MFKKVFEYLNNEEFKITMDDKMLHINEFITIDTFTDNKIIINTKKNKVIINGFNLVIKKMLNNEILIIGNIESVCLGE